MENFIQKEIYLNPEKSSGKLKVENLVKLIEDHPYKNRIYSTYNVEEIRDEYIAIDFIDLIYEQILHLNKKYNRHKINALLKNIDVYEEEILTDGEKEKAIMFHFEEYAEIDEVKYNLKARAIYNAKNTYLDEYVMTKYANSLFKKGLPELARYNVQFFKGLAERFEEYNKHKSYRLVEKDGVMYLRGITSVDQYYEYGVDFTFVISMLLLHQNMKLNQGTSYYISYTSVNESKLELIVSEKQRKDAGEFGKVSSSIKISTNDLGEGSLNFVNVIKVGKTDKHGFYLFPKFKRFDNKRLFITHTTKPENIFKTIGSLNEILNTSDEFINELNDVNTIRTPDELRVKILAKIQHPNSVFKGIKELSTIFNRKIDNEVTHFSKLMEMCNKAEELNIDFEIKDKLRYIISDIILYGKTA